jgi:hypothetical protein
MPVQTLSKKPLMVMPNPFASPLVEGRPAAIAAYDPGALPNGALPRYIGASIHREVVEHRAKGSNRKDRRATVMLFDMAEQPVPDTAYHRALVRSGELLSKDASTLKRCGAKPGALYVEDALKAWNAEHPEEEMSAEEAIKLWTVDAIESAGRPQIINWPSAG